MFRMTSLLLRKCPRFKELAASHPAHGQKVLLDIENRTEKALAFIRQSKGSRTDSVDASVSALWQLQEAPPQPRWSAISKEDWVRTHAASMGGRNGRSGPARRGLPHTYLPATPPCPCRRRISLRYVLKHSSNSRRTHVRGVLASAGHQPTACIHLSRASRSIRTALLGSCPSTLRWTHG